MSILRSCLLLFSILTLLVVESSFARGGSEGNSSDPYLKTIYYKAFKQDEIWKKFRLVLKAEKLEHLLNEPNQTILEEYAPEEIKPKSLFSCFSPAWTYLSSFCSSPQSNHYQELDQNSEIPIEELETFEKNLNRELVNHFLASKRDDAYQVIRNEIYSTGAYVGITGGLMGGAGLVLPPAVVGMGTGFSAFVIASQTAQAFYTSLKELININHFHGDPLLFYEVKYAIYKRFISPALWEMIEAKFSFARTNKYTQKEALEFFDIVFNLPKEKQSFLLTPPLNHPVAFPGDELKSKIKYTFDNLIHTIDEIYADSYENPEEIKLNLATALWEHIMASANRFHIKSNSLILGPPGVGKNRMTEEIKSRLKMPIISVNVGIVNSPSDLFGTKERPGLLLEAIVKAKIINAILLLDEATEIFNDNQFKSSLKILFEPSLGKFEAPYLNQASVEFQDFLVFALGNGQLGEQKETTSSPAPKKAQADQLPVLEDNDQGALASRFRISRHPQFKKEFIRTKAEAILNKILENHIYFQDLKKMDEDDQARLNQILDHSFTVRDLEKNLPTWCMYVNIKRMHSRE